MAAKWIKTTLNDTRPDQIQYQIGVPEQYRSVAAALYDEAFGPKLSLAVPNQAKRIRLLAASLKLNYVIGAIGEDEGDRLIDYAERRHHGKIPMIRTIGESIWVISRNWR